MTLINDDCLNVMKKMKSGSVDSIVTDPPYGIQMMNKEFDRELPATEIWKECFRVLKPGAFAFIMCASRLDRVIELGKQLEEVGFETKFTPIYWTFATGFPKAMNISKQVDKKLGLKQEIIGRKEFGDTSPRFTTVYSAGGVRSHNITIPNSIQAKKLDGSYAGYNPKPAIEIIIVVMKPLSEKSYTEQALKNGKGITHLDDVRIPTNEKSKRRHENSSQSPFAGDQKEGEWNSQEEDYDRPDWETHKAGRFPANLLVSDEVLNDGKITKGDKRLHRIGRTQGFWSNKPADYLSANHNDEGQYSRYFDLDLWFKDKILPFIITPKPSQSEKNAGLEDLDYAEPAYHHFRPTTKTNPENWANDPLKTPHGGTNRGGNSKNSHISVKPIKLMSYLIKLGSRKGDVILDPFIGSGTTAIACVLTDRKYIGVEMDKEYYEIAVKRLRHHEKKKSKIDYQKLQQNRI